MNGMILVALLLSALTPENRWTQVGGITNHYEEYVDTESIERSGDKVTLWTRRDLAHGQGAVWYEREFDCRMRKETVQAYIKDDGRSVSHNVRRPHREASLIPVGSVEEAIFKIVCR